MVKIDSLGDSGATLYKGMNRGIGTLAALSLAFLIDIVARHIGHIGCAICITFSVFLTGMYQEFRFHILRSLLGFHVLLSFPQRPVQHFSWHHGNDNLLLDWRNTKHLRNQKLNIAL